jgi:hypothetical protein
MMQLQPGDSQIVTRMFTSKRDDSKRSRSMSRMPFQVAAIVLFAFALFFVWDLSQRIVTNVRLMQAEKQLEYDVARGRATQTALVEKKKYVQSPAYVETVMRGGHWVEEGETVAVPQITPAATPTVISAPPTPTPTPEKSWWQDLLEFLFGP